MNTFDVLSNTTSIMGSWFLQASAGTGKTFTIEHLFVRLLLESDLSVDQILIVTFTRAATRELKMRLRTCLEKALHEPHLFPYLATLTPQAKEKIQISLLLFDQAQIFTIHGFCHKMLQECAFEAGMGLQLKPWTLEEEKKEALDFFRKVAKDYDHSQHYLLLKKFRNNIDDLIDTLLKTKPSLKPLISFEDALNKFKTLKAFPLQEIFEREVVHYKKMTHLSFRFQVQFLEKILMSKNCKPQDLSEIILQKPYFLQGFEQDNLKVKSLDHQLSEPLSLLREQLLPLISEISDPSVILKDLARKWREEKKSLSLEHDKISPDDILEKMEASLDCPACLQSVRQKYQAVIVDEFQDTDPIQWRIFDKLFLSKQMKALYLVGDPKQSIYAFRQADIYTFLKASEKFSFHAHLDTNYRSSPGLLHRLNQLFCHTPWIDLPALDKNLPVLPVKAGRQGEGSLHFFVVEVESSQEKKWPSHEVEKNYLFPFIVQEIQKAPSSSSIAILVKDRYQALDLHTFLQAWNLTSSIQRAEGLGSCLALSSLQDIMKAVKDQDLSLIKKAVLGPVIGWTEAYLNEENIFFAKEQFFHLNQLLKERGFGAFWARFLETKWSSITTLEYLVSRTQLTIYYDLQEIVQKIILEKDPERIEHLLKELKNSEISDRILGECGKIQIMTTHASKGLEFDVVFALGLASRTNRYEELKEEQLKEIDAEKMRQLYVAMTRAKHTLYVPFIKDLSQKPIPLGQASAIEIFWQRVKPVLEDYPHTYLNHHTFTHTLTSEPDKPHLVPALPQHPLSASQFILSFSSLSQKTSHLKVLSTSSFPSGTETGIILHAIFERVVKDQDRISDIVTEEIAGTLLENWASDILQVVDKTLNLPLTTFSLKDVSTYKMQPEMEFLFSTQKGLMKGFIDLWFEKDGKYFIVDWKTNTLEDYEPSHLEKAMQDGDYFLQASIYAEALKKHLARFDARPFEECFGGAFYIFIRGPSCFHFYPKILQEL